MLKKINISATNVVFFLTLSLAFMKMCGVPVSWVMVLAPLWFPIAVIFAFILIAFTLLLIVS